VIYISFPAFLFCLKIQTSIQAPLVLLLLYIEHLTGNWMAI